MGNTNESRKEGDTAIEDEQPIDSNHLYVDTNLNQYPIIFRDEYNIKLCGLEKLHPFDAGKWGNVVELLKSRQLVEEENLIQPNEANKEDLEVVHTKKYLRSLNWSWKVAEITEVLPAALLPNCVVQKKILRPFRFQTGGSILGGKLAVEHGWAINIGGGFHHCSARHGGGFCAYADISLAIAFTMNYFKFLKRAMIIDLDAHQGNGHERDFMTKQYVYILDVYNKYIYPYDEFAKNAINKKIELQAYTEDNEYLQNVERHVEEALEEFNPEFVVYNAGTDILKGDPLGLLNVSAKGIIERDEIVWRKVRERKIPVLMLTSGGYQRCTAKIIADSICNLHQKELITLKIT